MPLSGKLEAPISKSSWEIYEVTLQAALAAIQGAGIVHLVNAITAQESGGVVMCNDLVSGAVVLSASAAPTIGTAINGRPTMTFGSGVTGTTGQLMRPKRYGELDLGTGAWSICMLVRAMGTGSSDVIIGPERVATMASGNFSPYFRFAASGDKTLGVALFENDGTLRTTCNTHEFYNTNRVLLICGTPGVGIKWYVDNWSSAAVTSATTAAKAAFTDGKFVVGGYGPALSSLSFAGSLAIVTAHNVDLSLNNPARRALMQAIAAYGGITSN
nr:hypothetical protein [uncultured Shinella sp.]